MPVASVCTRRIYVSNLKLFVVLSWMLEDAECKIIGSYGVSGSARDNVLSPDNFRVNCPFNVA